MTPWFLVLFYWCLKNWFNNLASEVRLKVRHIQLAKCWQKLHQEYSMLLGLHYIIMIHTTMTPVVCLFLCIPEFSPSKFSLWSDHTFNLTSALYRIFPNRKIAYAKTSNGIDTFYRPKGYLSTWKMRVPYAYLPPNGCSGSCTLVEP